LLVRLNPFSVVLCDPAGQPLALRAALTRQPADTLHTLEVEIRSASGADAVHGWVHAYRLSEEQAHRARHHCRQRHKQGSPQAETLFLAGWVLVFTTLAPEVVSAQTIMALYRCRWQVELAIKRWKSVLDMDALRAKAQSRSLYRIRVKTGHSVFMGLSQRAVSVAVAPEGSPYPECSAQTA
jgi:hypothetical protein